MLIHLRNCVSTKKRVNFAILRKNKLLHKTLTLIVTNILQQYHQTKFKIQQPIKVKTNQPHIQTPTTNFLSNATKTTFVQSYNNPITYSLHSAIFSSAFTLWDENSQNQNQTNQIIPTKKIQYASTHKPLAKKRSARYEHTHTNILQTINHQKHNLYSILYSAATIQQLYKNVNRLQRTHNTKPEK